MADAVLESPAAPAPSAPAAPAAPAAPIAPSASTPNMREAGPKRAELYSRIAGRVKPPADNTPQAPAPSTATKPAASKPTQAEQPKPQAAKPANATAAIAAATPKPAEAAAKPAEAPAAEAKPAESADLSDDEIAARAADKSQKTNPWKLVQDYKKKIKQVEQAHEETRRLVADEPTRKAEMERVLKAETRAKELEDHIRYLDYAKSSEFKEKYQDPYTRAWVTSMQELGGLKATDDAGNEYTFTDNDMLELVRMPLAQARELAKAKWGDYAGDVMDARKEIRGLFDKQALALEDAKKNGALREKQAKEEADRISSEINNQVQKFWTSHNESMKADANLGKYLVPVEGDEEINSRLEKGYAMVDEAFSLNPMDAKLTQAQREEILKKHIAVRNRSGAFGAMRLRLERADVKIKALEDELAQYRASVPNLGGEAAPGTTPTGKADKMAGLFERIGKRAK